MLLWYLLTQPLNRLSVTSAGGSSLKTIAPTTATTSTATTATATTASAMSATAIEI